MCSRNKKQDVTMFASCITRFTHSTWKENCNWRERNELQEGCIYNTTVPRPVSVEVIPFLFMIEMNISDKSIIGVGLIRNYQEEKRHYVYSQNKYNLYTYKGRFRLSKSEFTEDEILKLEDLEVV